MRIFVMAAAVALSLSACGEAAPKRPAGGNVQAKAKAKVPGAVPPEGCPGFDPKQNAQQNAKRTGAFLKNEALAAAERARVIAELTATLNALPAWAPVYPCAFLLSADTPPDGSGILQLTFELDEDAPTVAAFYTQQFQGKGGVTSNVERGNGPVVHTVNVDGPQGIIDVHIQEFPAENGIAPPLSIVLRAEGLPV